MIADMERIGDQAADISEIVLYLSKKEDIQELEHIPKMAEATIEMVNASIDAFVKRDGELAAKVIQKDDAVDALFIQVRKDLINMIHQNADSGDQAMDLMMIAKYLERIGDHAVNIAEWVQFSITGEHKGRQIL